MNLIVAVDNNWGIGKNGNLIYHAPEDMKFFREKTLNKVVIMGRSTLESLPGGKPLPKRTNIVLSSTPGYEVEGIIVCRNLKELFETVKNYDSNDLYVIGGKIVYELLLDYCDIAYITKFNANKPADLHLINIGQLANWECVHTSEVREQDGLEFTFNTYKNNLSKLQS